MRGSAARRGRSTATVMNEEFALATLVTGGAGFIGSHMVWALVDAGDVVLAKGSKGIKVSLVVDALRKLGQGSGLSEQGPH